MISTHSRKYTAVLDACVLIPMCLCDTLLRFAEEPALYRPLWSELILKEAGNGLVSKIGLTAAQRDHRLREMQKAFPEAMTLSPPDLIACKRNLRKSGCHRHPEHQGLPAIRIE